MGKSVLLILITFCISFISNAQYSETIVSGRPGQSNGPFGVGKGVFQLQSGINFNNSTLEEDAFNLNRESEIIGHSTMFRYGLFEKTELRGFYSVLLRDQLRRKATFISSESNLSGFNNFTIGIRQHFIKQNGILPSVGLQLTAILGGLDDYETNTKLYQLRLLLQHKIFENLTLNTNFTYDYHPDIDQDDLDFVFSFGYRLSQKVGLVAELYGTYNSDEVNEVVGKTDLLLDAGISYLVNKDLALDVFGGYDIAEGESAKLTRSFVSVGVSYRIHNRD